MCVDLQVSGVILLILAGLTHVSTVSGQVSCVGGGGCELVRVAGVMCLPLRLDQTFSLVVVKVQEKTLEHANKFQPCLSQLCYYYCPMQSVWEDTEEGHDARRPQCSQQHVQSQNNLHKATGNLSLGLSRS